MRKIILIGDAPAIGKSHTAQKLAKEFKFSWISTDEIRKRMKKQVSRKDQPSLFFFMDQRAETGTKYLEKSSIEKIVKDQNNESFAVWKGVSNLIKKENSKKPLIIEGVAILPSLVAKLKKEKAYKDVNVMFLVDNDISRIRESIFKRGLWDKANKYPNNIKEKEVEWVTDFNSFITKEAKKYNFPIIDINDRKSYLKEIKFFIN